MVGEDEERRERRERSELEVREKKRGGGREKWIASLSKILAEEQSEI